MNSPVRAPTYADFYETPTTRSTRVTPPPGTGVVPTTRRVIKPPPLPPEEPGALQLTEPELTDVQPLNYHKLKEVQERRAVSREPTTGLYTFKLWEYGGTHFPYFSTGRYVTWVRETPACIACRAYLRLTKSIKLEDDRKTFKCPNKRCQMVFKLV